MEFEISRRYGEASELSRSWTKVSNKRPIRAAGDMAIVFWSAALQILGYQAPKQSYSNAP